MTFFKMKEEFLRWEREVLQKFLEKSPERKAKFKTSYKSDIKRIYTPLDHEGFDYLKKLGFPGEFPFTRGVQPTMYRGKIWTMRQYAGYGSAEDTNKRFLYLLQQGQTGLSVAFDLPTQMGYDSDHPLAKGEVGRVGVAIDTVEDMKVLFKNIDLSKVSTSMTINATASIILSMYAVTAMENGVNPSQLRGTVQNDILKEYAARGTYIFPPEPSLFLAVDLMRYANKNMPEFNTISVSGYHIREAGANAVQEIAFTLSNGIQYLEAAQKLGLDIEKLAQRMSFFFDACLNILEEVAKFRAARRLWARLLRERFNIKEKRSLMLRFHAQTAGCELTAQEPLNNIIRVTIQALAAVLGGAQSLHTNSFDEALSLPSEESVKIALRTQQIIAHETGIDASIDPLGGSYMIESLTDEIEEKSLEYIKKIDEMGGALKAIEEGFIQKEISQSAYETQMELERREKIVVGVNAFGEGREEKVKILKVDPEKEIEQVNKLKKVKSERNEKKVKESLERLKESAFMRKNVTEEILECVRERATLGEIVSALEEIYGRYKG